MDYKSAGVDIELGDSASEIMYNAARETWKNRKGKLGEVIIPFDDFSGIRFVDVSNLPEGTVMSMGVDGVGTKIEAAERMSDHTTIAYNLFAMVCDDAAVRGAEPVLVGSILDVNTLKKDGEGHIRQVRQLAVGYIKAAYEANVVVINGEVAELGNRVGGFGHFNYNWGAAVVWFAKKDRLLTGHEIGEGDFLVGLREDGFRSNGISLVRRIFQNRFGDQWHENDSGAGSLGEKVLHPSRIYTRAIIEMTGGYENEPMADLHGAAHITGGGIPGKLGRILKPSGLGAVIDDPFGPSSLMLQCQSFGKVPDKEAYSTWCMGHGMIVITQEPDKVMEVAKKYGIDSKIVGVVVRKKGIRIKSKGFYSKKEIVF